MSCMELSKEHYQFIADQLDRISNPNLLEFYESRRALNFEMYDSRHNEFQIVSFINKLQYWNDHAWHDRYPDEEPNHDYDLVLRVSKSVPQFEPYQFLKALECAEYQCCDSDLYMESPERKIVQKLIKDCLNYIAHQSDFYQSAKWGL